MNFNMIKKKLNIKMSNVCKKLFVEPVRKLKDLMAITKLLDDNIIVNWNQQWDKNRWYSSKLKDGCDQPYLVSKNSDSKKTLNWDRVISFKVF